MVFGSFDPIYKVDLRPKIFLILVENFRDRLNFMLLGVLGEYPARFFLHILHMRINNGTFQIFSEYL
jgi:hypothetical protein